MKTVTLTLDYSSQKLGHGPPPLPSLTWDEAWLNQTRLPDRGADMRVRWASTTKAPSHRQSLQAATGSL